MSSIEDANRAQNLQAVEDRKVAEAEHLVEMSRASLASEALYDPKLIAFKKRRQDQAAQTRWWKPSVDSPFPKKRQF